MHALMHAAVHIVDGCHTLCRFCGRMWRLGKPRHGSRWKGSCHCRCIGRQGEQAFSDAPKHWDEILDEACYVAHE